MTTQSVLRIVQTKTIVIQRAALADIVMTIVTTMTANLVLLLRFILHILRR